EREPEAVVPLSKIFNFTSVGGSRVESKTVNVYVQNPTFRSRGDIDYMVQALRRGVE
ncbi:hypothetical protein G4O51_12405, partial [Candidatus Bathyarchaeota archaeon A05DMB-2]|nr:hypothetical protein [Candidatus Bathyarchaeota archaeon A05DMB-2]